MFDKILPLSMDPPISLPKNLSSLSRVGQVWANCLCFPAWFEKIFLQNPTFPYQQLFHPFWRMLYGMSLFLYMWIVVKMPIICSSSKLMKLTFPLISLVLILLFKEVQTPTALGSLYESLSRMAFLVSFKVWMIKAAFYPTWGLKHIFCFIWFPLHYLLSMKFSWNQQLV